VREIEVSQCSRGDPFFFDGARAIVSGNADGPRATSRRSVSGSAHRGRRVRALRRAPGTMPVSPRAGWLLIFARRRACRWRPARGLPPGGQGG